MNKFDKTPIYLLYSDEQNNNIYIKREDLIPYSFGGNKVRIALAFFDDMQKNDKNHLIAYGNPKSNLCRVLSNICAAKNIKCTIISKVSEENNAVKSYNELMSIEFNAEIIYCKQNTIAETVEREIDKSIKNGLKPYYIFGNKFGEGNDKIPVSAYFEVYNEIQSQSRELKTNFDIITHATGTGTTQAGLICGKIMSDKKTNIIGFSIARKSNECKNYLNRYINAYLLKNNNYNNEIQVYDKYSLSYGVYNNEIAKCIKDMMTLYGLPLDTTYTGKAFYSMQQYLIDNKIFNNNVLFIHTGGLPLFFDNMETILCGEKHE